MWTKCKSLKAKNFAYIFFLRVLFLSIFIYLYVPHHTYECVARKHALTFGSSVVETSCCRRREGLYYERVRALIFFWGGGHRMWIEFLYTYMRESFNSFAKNLSHRLAERVYLYTVDPRAHQPHLPKNQSVSKIISIWKHTKNTRKCVCKGCGKKWNENAPERFARKHVKQTGICGVGGMGGGELFI